MLELKRVKEEKFGKYRQGDEEGKDGWRTVAWTDTFTGQGQYLLASSAYCLPRYRLNKALMKKC